MRVVKKNTSKPRLETKGYDTDLDSVGSPKQGFFCPFLNYFSLSNAKI